MSECIHTPGAILMVGGGTIKLGKYYFEMHDYCGPLRTTRSGDGYAQDFGKDFWPMFKAWDKAGRQIDSDGNGVTA